jgi:hypothetical protein
VQQGSMQRDGEAGMGERGRKRHRELSKGPPSQPQAILSKPQTGWKCLAPTRPVSAATHMLGMHAPREAKAV